MTIFHISSASTNYICVSQWSSGLQTSSFLNKKSWASLLSSPNVGSSQTIASDFPNSSLRVVWEKDSYHERQSERWLMVMHYITLVSTCHFCLSYYFKLVLTLFLLFHIFQHPCLGKASLAKESFRSEQPWHATPPVSPSLIVPRIPGGTVQLFFLPPTQ